MNWIIQNLITNKRNNNLIYGVLFSIILLDFLNDELGFIPEKYLVINFSLYALGLIIFKEIIGYWYKNLYRRNQKILDEIKEMARNGNYLKIIELTKLVKSVPPQLTEKNYWIGFANVYLNNPDKALQMFDSIESEYKNFSGLLYHKGLALYDSGEIEKAIEYLTRSVELQKTWQNLDQRGAAYMSIDKLEKAEKDLRESIGLKEDSSNTCNLGILLGKKGKHSQALELFNRSIDKDSGNANAFYNRALSRQKLNELKLAIEDFDKASNLGNDNNYLYLNRGFCKCQSGDIPNGLMDLKKAKDLNCEKAIGLIEKFDNQ